MIKSRRCLSVKMKELMGSFCCSCDESVEFGYPQNLWKLWPPILKNLFCFYGPLQKHLHPWLLHLLAAFVVHSCHCGCTCLTPIIPCALRKENHLARKDSKCTSDLSSPSPSSVWQSKTSECPLKLSRMRLFTIRVQGLCVENVIHDSSLLTTPVIIFL